MVNMYRDKVEMIVDFLTISTKNGVIKWIPTSLSLRELNWGNHFSATTKWHGKKFYIFCSRPYDEDCLYVTDLDINHQNNVIKVLEKGHTSLKQLADAVKSSIESYVENDQTSEVYKLWKYLLKMYETQCKTERRQ